MLISQPPAQRMPFDDKDSTSLDVWEEHETVILIKQCKSLCIIDYIYLLDSSGLAGVQKGVVVRRVIYHLCQALKWRDYRATAFVAL